MSIRARTTTLLQRLRAANQATAWLSPFVARVTLGILFMSTGWGKVHHVAQVAAFFTELGIPAPAFHAALVSFVELVGGTMLMLGILTELAALPLMVSMLVAIITAKRGEITGIADLFGLVEWTYFVLLLWLAQSSPHDLSLTSAWRNHRHPRSAHRIVLPERETRATVDVSLQR